MADVDVQSTCSQSIQLKEQPATTLRKRAILKKCVAPTKELITLLMMKFQRKIAVNELGEDSESWKVQLKLENVQTTFKLDFGADVTVIPENVYQKTGKQLQKTNAKLTGPGQYKLKVLGVIEAQLIANSHNSTKQKIYAVSGLKSPLLGRPAIQALNLLIKVEI